MRIARNNRGFTLIEMAIVLIIIGIILGAVVKGKDLIRSGEQKKVLMNPRTIPLTSSTSSKKPVLHHRLQTQVMPASTDIRTAKEGLMTSR
ncbi:MAG: hypothetical protein B5M56_11265 [Desulfococcus sp. 4484_241]|nr:MAG: hypothetical protein B5M56_11265 [Desulfococcus sp. 4484_241]